MRLRIESTLLENNVIPASIAGVTDLLFHLLRRGQGVGCVVTGMVSARAVLYNNRNTRELLQIHPQERPATVQLFDSDPEIMGKIAARIENRPYDLIDVSMGCPVSKIINNREGFALMGGPKKADGILTVMIRAVRKPMTVKFRKGFNDSCINGVEFARMAESYRVVAVAVHGWTRERYYSGRAGWDIIRRAKETVEIPVVGSGDIFTPQDAGHMVEEASYDGLMVARGAKGSPRIFRRINHCLDTGELLSEPSTEEAREMVLRHDRMLVKYKGESTATREIRGHIARYTKGMPHSATLRNEINQVGILEGLAKLLNQRIPVNTGGKDGNHS